VLGRGGLVLGGALVRVQGVHAMLEHVHKEAVHNRFHMDTEVAEHGVQVGRDAEDRGECWHYA